MHNYDVIALFFAGIFVSCAISYQITMYLLRRTVHNTITLLQDNGIIEFEED